MKRWILVLAFAFVWLMAAAAGAQQNNLAEAKRLFRAGARAYDAGQFAAAVQAFDQAYELSPRPPLRFSSAQALKRLYTTERKPHLLKKAQGYYQQYVDEVKKGKRVKDAVEALGEIELLLSKHKPKPKPPPVDGSEEGPDGEGGGIGQQEPEVVAPPPKTTGTLQVDSDIDGAVAVVQGHAEKLTDLPQWLELKPGTYRVSISAVGYDDGVRTVRVAAGRLSLADPPLREKLGRLKIEGDAGADVLIDGRPEGEVPLSLELPSGDHRIVIGDTGYDIFTTDVSLGRGDTQTVEADLSMTTKRIIAWVVLGGAGVTISAGIVLAFSAGSSNRQAREIDDLTQGPNARALTVEERNAYNGHIETRDNLARFAGGAFALGALAAGAGLMLALLDEPDLYAAALGDEDEEKKSDDMDEDRPPIELDARVVPLMDGPTLGGALIIRGRF